MSKLLEGERKVQSEDPAPPKPKTFIEEIEVINNTFGERFTYKCKEAPFGLAFGYSDKPESLGVLIINRKFSEDGKLFEGVARLSNFSIVNLKLK